MVMPPSNGEDIDLFVSRLKEAGGEGAILTNRDHFAEWLSAVVTHENIAKVAVSGGSLIRHYHVLEILDRLGITAWKLEGQATSTRNLATADAVVTDCELAFSDTGTIIVASGSTEGILATALPQIHVILVGSDRIRSNPREAAREIQELCSRYPFVSFITGPSRTGDVESTLTVGVHGPRSVNCIVVPVTQEI
jgi:L-lactate dehydrogenase complex protein LldG